MLLCVQPETAETSNAPELMFAVPLLSDLLATIS